MKGYKAFESDLKCRDYQYKENEPHVFIGDVVLCESGFHFCTELQDVVKYYCKPTMRVFEIEASGIITDVESGCSKIACSELKLVRELSLEEVKNHITGSEQAYRWVYAIGDQEHMKQFVTVSEYAYRWAKFLGDQEHMRQFVTDSIWAYYWARDIGDREHMRQYITDSQLTKQWVRYIDSKDEQYFKDRGVI